MVAKTTSEKNTFDITTSTALKVIADAADKAASKIDTATNKAADILASAAEKAITALASAAKDASTLLSSNASDAMKISNMKNEGDHDLLIRLETKMAGLKDDIREIKDGTATKISQHETRIFALETAKGKQNVFVTVGIVVLGILTSLVIYHLTGIKI